MLDDGREVTSAAVLHNDVKDTRLAVNISVVVANYVFMVKVLENVSGKATTQNVSLKREEWRRKWTNTSATICFLSRSVIRSKLSSFLAKTLNDDTSGEEWERGNERVDTDETV